MKKLLLIPAMLLSLHISAQYAEVGFAVYYADYLHGSETAYGEIYDRDEFTCAHPSLPKNTLLRVSRVDNDESVLVRVNDKGPFKEGYIVDLSLAAAEAIDLVVAGRRKVQVEQVGFSQDNPTPAVATSDTRRQERSLLPESFDVNLRNEDTTATKGPEYEMDMRRLPPDTQGFGIQLGSYSEVDNAIRQGKALRQLGIQGLYLQPSRTQSAGQIFRIIVADFASRNQASNYLDQLRRQHNVNGFVFRL